MAITIEHFKCLQPALSVPATQVPKRRPSLGSRWGDAWGVEHPGLSVTLFRCSGPSFFPHPGCLL